MSRWILLLPLFFSLVSFTFAQEESPSDPLAPCDLLLSQDQSQLYILEEGTNRLRITAEDGSAPPRFVSLPFTPRVMTFFPGEEKIAIAGGGPEGSVAIVSAEKENERLEQVFPTGHTPSGVAVGWREDGALSLYVACRFDNTVWEIDAQSGEKRREFSVGREPYTLRIAPDHKRLATTSLIAARRADVFNTMAMVHIIELSSGEVFEVPMRNGVTNLYGSTFSPDGSYLFVTGTMGNYQTVTSQVVGGWIVENSISVVDPIRHELVDIFFLDDSQRGAANPWGISISPDGSFLAVALSGTNEILLMPYQRMMEILQSRSLESRPGGGTYVSYLNDMGENLPMRIRAMFPSPGIRALVVRGNQVWALSFFRDLVNRLDIELTPPYKEFEKKNYRYPKAPPLLDPESDTVKDADAPLKWVELESLHPFEGMKMRRWFARLGPEPTPSQERRGEELFYNGLICMEHWQSCITCHPDGRADGLNWDLLNDGMGNPKNTKSLLLSHETPPSMITGIRADAETAVRAGVIHILFSKLPEEDYEAMDAYLKAMKPVPSPHLVHGELSPSAQRGKFLFNAPRVGCCNCHPEPLFTDLSYHRSECLQCFETHTRFDTPTLIEVWRTAPYMNNGQWLNLRDLLIEAKHGNKDGRLDHLTEEELNDLIEYVLSL